MVLRIRSLLLACLLTAGLDARAQQQYAYRISFRDKAGAPQLSANPSWLSSRSVARRTNFGIPFDSTDRPVSPVYIDSVLRYTGGVMHTRSRWLNQCVILIGDTARLRGLSNVSFVAAVEWVGYFPGGLHPKPGPRQPGGPVNPYTRARTSGTAAHYGSTWTAVSMVNGDHLHDRGLDGRGKLIAMIDEGFTGVDTQPVFDSMRRAGRLIETHNFLQNTTNVFMNGSHGTGCLSPVAGYRPGSYVGTAPAAEYALYITEDGSVTDGIYELDNLIAAMERADSLGADVISASIVYNFFVAPFSTLFTKAELNGHTTNVARAANLAVKKGIVYVSSAGNEGNNDWNFLDSPGDADSVLTVGSVNTIRTASVFSSPGPNSSGRVKPDVCLLGEPVPVFDSWGDVYNQNGTSFAAPQLAGYVACLLQANPKATPFVIRNAIHRSAHLYTAPTAKLGYGIPDFRTTLDYMPLPDTTRSADIRVGPNPFTDVLHVNLGSLTGDPVFQLHDISGRVIPLTVQDLGSGRFQLRVPGNLPAAIYVLDARTGGQRKVMRVVHLP